MMNILVVDHAARSSRSIRKLLPEAGVAGCAIDFTTGYQDIVEGFRGKAYDACIIDSASENGLRLFAQARSLGYTAPVILVISDDAGEAVDAIRSGVADCLIRNDMTAAAIERSICCVVEQARASSQQTERERRYLALIDNTDEIICTHDLEGNVTSMNSTAEQVIGYSHEESLSLTVSEMVAPEYRNVVQQMIQQTLDAQRQTFREVELVTKQGESVLVEVGSHLIYHQGKAVEIQWVARELSAPKQSAARLIRNVQLYSAKRNWTQSLNA